MAKGFDVSNPSTTTTWKEIDLGHGKVAIVDEDVFEIINRFKWHILEKHGLFYARHTSYDSTATPKYKSILMHRLIMDTPVNLFVDHINGNGLDNRKQNMRNCTNSENLLNQSPRRNGSSKYRGVHWHKIDKRWTVTITKNRKRKRIGGFLDEIEAAKEYDKAAKELHGEFARLNFLEKGVV